jgi:hypothetical protein
VLEQQLEAPLLLGPELRLVRVELPDDRASSKSSCAVAASFQTIVKRRSQRLASPAWFTG